MISKKVIKEIEVRARLQYRGRILFFNLKQCGYFDIGTKDCQRKWDGTSALTWFANSDDVIHIFLPCSIHAKKLKDEGWEEV